MILNIKANEGYEPEQVENARCITVGELKEWLEQFDDDEKIITKDLNNKYGADYGIICDCEN